MRDLHCHMCHTPLKGGIDTFGDVGEELCRTCWIGIGDGTIVFGEVVDFDDDDCLDWDDDDVDSEFEGIDDLDDNGYADFDDHDVDYWESEPS